MAALRSSEERNSKGETTRLNPTLTWIQAPEIRKVVGRTDYRMEDNPLAHPPITAQVQEGKLYFFRGSAETPQARKNAKQITTTEVPAYIIKALEERPLRYRESRPVVQEVRIVKVGDEDMTEVTEIEVTGGTVTVQAVSPELLGDRKSAVAA